MTTQADHEMAKAYALKVIVPPDRLEKIFENECNLAACYLDSLHQINALENDLAIADLAWKAEKERRKQIERETLERCAMIAEYAEISNDVSESEADAFGADESVQYHRSARKELKKVVDAIRALSPSTPAADGKE